MAEYSRNNRMNNSNQQIAMEQNELRNVAGSNSVQDAVSEVTSALAQAGAPSHLQQEAQQSVQEVASDTQTS